IHQLDKDEFIDCLYELYNKESMDFYSSFETMLYGKFGRAITDKFLRPYNEKLYSCDLNELDVDAMGRFFPYTDLDSVIKNMKHKTDDSYNNTFLYPKDGAEVFINALFSEVDSNKYFFNQDILSVNLKNKIVKTTQGSFYYEYLINTIPFDKFLSLTEDYSYSKKDAESLTSNKVLVFNLGFNKKSKLTNEHWVYIPSKNINFYRIGFYDNILNSDKLSMYVEIGYQSAIETKDIDIENELELTITNLKKLDIIDDHTLVSYESIIMDPAYVHISKDSNKFKAKCFSDLIEQDVYMVGRYGQWKYCSIEDSMLDARNAIKMIKDKQV
ncbi:LPS biosynthesis protein, partial [Vibrio cholerae]|nr:LPS biosynthesis protein [Vibrio cholerae]